MKKYIKYSVLALMLNLSIFSYADSAFKLNSELNQEVDYESDLIRIFENILSNKEFSKGFKLINEKINDKTNETDNTEKSLAVKNLSSLKMILEATKNHRMILKSILLVPGWESVREKDCDITCSSQIRVTWSDKENNLIVKALYKLSTDSEYKTLNLKKDHFNGAIPRIDFMLERGYYADKNRIDNIKIMSRKNKGEEYLYYELKNLYELKKEGEVKFNIDKMPPYFFKSLGYKHCESCHEASPDKSKVKSDIFNTLGNHGAFFTRYQYKNELPKVLPDIVFNENSKKMYKVNSNEAIKIGFPDLIGNVNYQILNVSKDNKLTNASLKSDLATYNDFKVLYTNLQILENTALKMKENYCLKIIKDGEEKFQYICANYEERVLRSNIQNVDKNFGNTMSNKQTKY